jgi:hypothetical protein
LWHHPDLRHRANLRHGAEATHRAALWSRTESAAAHRAGNLPPAAAKLRGSGAGDQTRNRHHDGKPRWPFSEKD